MQNQDLIHCYECEHCFRNKRSKTGYSCQMWGHGEFADNTQLDGFCHKAAVDETLLPLRKYRIFKTRDEAETVLLMLKETVARYGFASRSDFLEFAGAEAAAKYIDIKYGWTKSAIDRTAQVVETPLGYFIELPHAFPLD